MGYKWRPNKSQRKAFAIKMQDPENREIYESKMAKERTYEYWKDKNFVPTKEQHDFCLEYINLFVTSEEKEAVGAVMYGYSCNEKVNHSHIHIINEKRRNVNI